MHSPTRPTIGLLALALSFVIPDASQAEGFRMPRVSVPGPRIANAGSIRFHEGGSRRNSDYRNGAEVNARTSGQTGTYIPYFEDDCTVLIGSVVADGSIRGNIDLTVEMGDLEVHCR